MAETKKGIYKVNNGTDFDTIHFETEASLVKMLDGDTMENKIGIIDSSLDDMAQQINDNTQVINTHDVSILKNTKNISIVPRKNIVPSQTGYISSNGYYNHFGLIYKLNNGATAIFHREAPNHVNSAGKIILRKSYDGGKTFDYNVIVSDALDNRFIGGLVLANGRFILIYGKSVVATTISVTGIYMKYSDDNGATWSNEQQIYTTNYNECLYGKAVELTDRIIQPFYYVNTTVRVSFLQSLDGGLTWTKGIDIYNGAENITETSLQAVGNTIISISRNENHTFKLAKSDDLGTTWSIVGDINFAGEYPVSPSLDYFENSNGKPFIVLYYADRTSYYMKRRYIAFSDIGDVTKWSSAKNLASFTSASASGYISTIRYGNTYKYVYFDETSSTVTNIIASNDRIEDIADFDSGWVSLAVATTSQVAHNLAVAPRKVVCLLTNTLGGTAINIGDTIKTSTVATTLRVDGTNYYLSTGSAGIYQYLSGTGTVNSINSGYARVLLWI